MKAAGAAFGLAVAALLPLAAAEGERWFDDITASAGLSAPHRNRQFDNEYATIMAGYTALGAAAAVADFDGDGFDDLFVTDSAVDGRNRLYRNNGNLTFADVTAASGLGTGNDPASRCTPENSSGSRCIGNCAAAAKTPSATWLAASSNP